MAERNQPEERLKFAQALNEKLCDGTLVTVLQDPAVPNELRVSLRGHLIELLTYLQSPRASGPDFGIRR